MYAAWLWLWKYVVLASCFLNASRYFRPDLLWWPQDLWPQSQRYYLILDAAPEEIYFVFVLSSMVYFRDYIFLFVKLTHWCSNEINNAGHFILSFVLFCSAFQVDFDSHPNGYISVPMCNVQYTFKSTTEYFYITS